MSENAKDTQRSLAAVKAILDHRDPVKDCSAVLVTAEQAIALLLLACMGTPKLAAGMLNEGLLQGVEERLALYASKERSR